MTFNLFRQNYFLHKWKVIDKNTSTKVLGHMDNQFLTYLYIDIDLITFMGLQKTPNFGVSIFIPLYPRSDPRHENG